MLFLILLSLYFNAQPCTEASLLNKPGIWKEGMKGSVSGIPAADLELERKVVEAIHLLLKSTYSPIGVEADYNGRITDPMQKY